MTPMQRLAHQPRSCTQMYSANSLSWSFLHSLLFDIPPFSPWNASLPLLPQFFVAYCTAISSQSIGPGLALYLSFSECSCLPLLHLLAMQQLPAVYFASACFCTALIRHRIQSLDTAKRETTFIFQRFATSAESSIIVVTVVVIPIARLLFEPKPTRNHPSTWPKPRRNPDLILVIPTWSSPESHLNPTWPYLHPKTDCHCLDLHPAWIRGSLLPLHALQLFTLFPQLLLSTENRKGPKSGIFP